MESRPWNQSTATPLNRPVVVGRCALVCAVMLLGLTGEALYAQNDGARTLPIPTQPQEIAPPGPPQSAAKLIWDVPEDWRVEQPRSNMRYAQYKTGKAGAEAELIVFYFGPGQGGDPMSNAARWAGQFSQPDGRNSTEVTELVRLEGTPFPTLLVKLTGRYNGGMSGPEIDQAMLLGAIVEGPDAPWFFKVVGPEATVKGASDSFEKLVRSVRKEP